MRLTQIDLNLFLVFDAIRNEGSLTRAAQVLSVTQPAVSNALARLRAALGDPLFVRAGSGMTPTAFADSIAPQVAQALQLLAVAAQPPAQFDPARSARSFRLSMPDLFNSLVLAPLAARLEHRAPQVSLRNFRAARGELRPALARGNLDLAIEVALPDTTGLIALPFRSERHVCALRPGHPMARAPLTLDRYLALGHVHVSGRRRGSGAVDLALKSIGARRRVHLRLQHFLAVGTVVAGSDLAVSLPESWARLLGLTALPLPFDVPPQDTFLYRHSRSDGDAAVMWLWDMLADQART